jgi:AcrR family transcriptional regulator
MRDVALTPEQILQTTEDVLRRFGPAKASVVDVARALGVSHGSVYRHFPSKSALRAAVTRRWLERAHGALQAVAEDASPAPERLHGWLATLFAAKRQKALDDPELFATYSVLVEEASTVVADHIDDLTRQISRIITDGIASGDFTVVDAGAAARAVFDATARFHDPVHASEWSRPDIDAAFEAVCALVLSGLRAPQAAGL